MKFLHRLRDGIIRFMYGRNGVDQLGWALLAAEILCSLLGNLADGLLGNLFHLLSTVLSVLLLYRIFSRNLVKRRAENARFMRWWGPVLNEARGRQQRRMDKTHKYSKCSCGAWCRVPRNVGKVELTCPKCGKKTLVKT